MNYQWIGMGIVIAGCGGVGARMAWLSRQQNQNLRSLIDALRDMEKELEYRMLPLPQLCRQAAETSHGIVKTLLEELNQELMSQVAPNAKYCMQAVLGKHRELDPMLHDLLDKLGTSLGRFDLAGQLDGLQVVQAEAQDQLDRLRSGQAERLRSYQTLGLCAGAALAILFL